MSLVSRMRNRKATTIAEPRITVTHEGVEHLLPVGVDEELFKSRLYHGLTPEDAATRPFGIRARNRGFNEPLYARVANLKKMHEESK